jgi:hypothetical protein
MYLYLGGEAAVEDRDIVGIFDLDKASQAHITRKFLAAAEKAGRVTNVAEDIPKTFVVLADENVILAQPNSAILTKRTESN